MVRLGSAQQLFDDVDFGAKQSLQNAWPAFFKNMALPRAGDDAPRHGVAITQHVFLDHWNCFGFKCSKNDLMPGRLAFVHLLARIGRAAAIGGKLKVSAEGFLGLFGTAGLGVGVTQVQIRHGA